MKGSSGLSGSCSLVGSGSAVDLPTGAVACVLLALRLSMLVLLGREVSQNEVLPIRCMRIRYGGGMLKLFSAKKGLHCCNIAQFP